MSFDKSVHASTGKDDWCTPDPILDILERMGDVDPRGSTARPSLMDVGVELDPCWNANSRVQAARRWTILDDALSRDWTSDGLIYCNPPYSRGLQGRFLEKCAYAQAPHVVALVPARTDTKAWHQAMRTVATVAFIKGRLRFDGAPASAPFPSALLYWGERPEALEGAMEPGFATLMDVRPAR